MAVSPAMADDEKDLGGTRRRFRQWVLPLLALAVFTGACAYVGSNEVQSNTQFDQTRRVLVTTRQRTAVAVQELTLVRKNLDVIDDQISVSRRALSSDSAQLQAVNAALSRSRADYSQQSTYIANLKVCQGGVQQALNALSVGDQLHAVGALNAVSTACHGVAASDA